MSKFISDIDTARNSTTGAIYDIAPKQGHSVGEGNSGWGDACVILPWTLYEAYADKTVLEDNYAMMADWIRYYTAKAGNARLLPADAYGDWLAVETTPGDVTATAFYAYSTSLMAKISEVLGKTEQAKQYRQLFEEIRTAFVNAYVNESTGKIKGDTQTVYALALRFDLLPTETLRQKAAENLVTCIEKAGMHLSTGTMGCAHLLPALSEAGRDDIAYQLLLTESYPSWLYSVVNGATTIWGSPTAELITEAMRGGAIFAINTAVSSPSGTPSTIAPAVPYTLVRINGRIPNCSVPELHVSPKRKSMIPT